MKVLTFPIGEAAEHSVQLTVDTRRVFRQFPGFRGIPFRGRIHAPTHRG